MGKMVVRLSNGISIEIDDASNPVVVPAATVVKASKVEAAAVAVKETPFRKRRVRRKRNWFYDDSNASNICKYIKEKYPLDVSAHELSKNLGLTIKQVCDCICGVFRRRNCLTRTAKGRYKWLQG